LNSHVPPNQKYPSADSLRAVSRSGLGGYGLKSAEGPLCEGTEPLIQAIDAIQDGGYIWVLLWGGANVLAQALLNIKKSRSEDELANLPQNFESMQYRTKMIPAPGFGFIFQRVSTLHLLMGVRFFTSLTFSRICLEHFVPSQIVVSVSSLVRYPRYDVQEILTFLGNA
jgi:hypothetical protein